MNKHHTEITDAQKDDLINKAKELSKLFEQYGKRSDDEGTFAKETIEPYRNSGILEALVPKKWGGHGGDMLTGALIGRELAKGDAATALSYNMHQSMVGIFRTTTALDEPKREKVMRAVSADKKILCGTFSEARAGLSGLADTTAVPDPKGGWRISGRKNWSTLIEASDLVSMNATITDAEGNLPDDFREHAKQESMFIFPKDLPGVKIEYTWDTLGMRGTGSHTLVLDNVHVDESMYSGNFRQGLIGEAEWAAIMFGGVYLGLADRAYEETVKALKKKHSGATLGGNDSAAKDTGYVQYQLGQMHFAIQRATRAYEHTAEMAMAGKFDGLHPVVRKAELDVAKVATTEAAVYVTDQALRLLGGPAFSRGHIIERLFRDSRAGILHSFNTNALYDTLGKAAFGFFDQPK